MRQDKERSIREQADLWKGWLNDYGFTMDIIQGVALYQSMSD